MISLRCVGSTSAYGYGVVSSCRNRQAGAGAKPARTAAAAIIGSAASTTSNDEILNLGHAGRGSPVTRCGKNFVFGIRCARHFGSEQQTHNAAHGLTHVAVNNANRT